MTTANPTFNPVVTTNAAGSFNTESVGYVQGTALDQPAVRFALSGGILASTETLPMWGGVAISESIASGIGTGIPETGSSSVLGSSITRAANITAHTTGQLTGWSVFDQNYSAVQSPQSPVPLTGTAMQVNVYRLGSGARIAVACDPALKSLDGGLITQQVSWDWVNQLLVPYTGTLTISSGTYNNTTGVIVLTMSAPVSFSAGDAVVLSSLTGSGGYVTLNGTWTATAVSGSTVTLAGPVGAGTSAITGGSATLGSGSDVEIPVDVLDINVGNSMTVSYNSTTGFATWNRSGSCAIILI